MKCVGRRPGAPGVPAAQRDVLSRVNNTNSGQNVKTVRTDPDHDDSLDIIKLEDF